jgi:hypothetical protein
MLNLTKSSAWYSAHTTICSATCATIENTSYKIILQTTYSSAWNTIKDTTTTTIHAAIGESARSIILGATQNITE